MPFMGTFKAGMKNLLSLIILLSANICNCQTNTYLPGFDFVLFKDTPLFALAEAVEAQDTAKMADLVHEGKLDINYSSPKFGTHLLSMALVNKKNNSAIKLLSLGADPNAKPPNDIMTPFFWACHYIRYLDSASLMLTLLIKYGANINEELPEKLETPDGKIYDYTASPLQLLCEYGALDCIKILINHGADLSKYPVNGTKSIIYIALNNLNPDVLAYFLIEKKVPVPDYCMISYEGTPRERKMTITALLNERPKAWKQYYRETIGQILDFLKKIAKS